MDELRSDKDWGKVNHETQRFNYGGGGFYVFLPSPVRPITYEAHRDDRDREAEETQDSSMKVLEEKGANVVEEVRVLNEKKNDDLCFGTKQSGCFSLPSHALLLIALWHQKASKRADGVVLWDYHVICIQIKSGGDPPLVWDLDSSLPFPSPLASYVSETIRPSFQLFPDFHSYGFVSRKLVSSFPGMIQ